MIQNGKMNKYKLSKLLHKTRILSHMKSLPHIPKIHTVIDGSADPARIKQALSAYMSGLRAMVFPKHLGNALNISADISPLERAFEKRSKLVSRMSADIILQINTRAQIFASAAYQQLKKRDESLWNIPHASPILYGALACVDKGVPSEAIAGLEVYTLGRVLAGDIRLSYIPTKNVFIPVASALIKRFIHYGRQGHRTLVEPIIEHTTCGRRAQMLANEEGHTDIPTLGTIFENIDALTTEFPGRAAYVRTKLDRIKEYWRSRERRGTAVLTPDGGLYTGIIQKIAQRQALGQLRADIRIISPIEVYEKETGNLYAGLDALEVLTHKDVLSEGGFTKHILDSFSNQSRIFSLKKYAPPVFDALNKRLGNSCGARTYNDLQKEWLVVQKDLVTTTETLWDLLNKKSSSVTAMVHAYFMAWNHTPPDMNSVVDRRIIHHLFHVTSYAFVLNTFEKGSEPGKHHIEHYLATGDHEIGTKPLIALGQGDLDRPSASEMFTGYSVLLHSSPGHDGTPIPVIIKLDTDRAGDIPMSTEETNVAFEDMQEFFKLWPYFLVGEMIPILMVRGKIVGGISRLGLSILRSFGDMIILLEQSPSLLPRFVPAATTHGEVVLVPARDVIDTGLQTGNNLPLFRTRLMTAADSYANPVVQKAFAHEMTQIL